MTRLFKALAGIALLAVAMTPSFAKELTGPTSIVVNHSIKIFGNKDTGVAPAYALTKTCIAPAAMASNHIETIAPPAPQAHKMHADRTSSAVAGSTSFGAAAS